MKVPDHIWTIIEAMYPIHGGPYCQRIAKSESIELSIDAIQKHCERRGIRFVGADGSKAKQEFHTHFVIPDTQCKPDVPLEHLLWLGRYIKEKQPEVVIHLGDHWDMSSLSSYEKPGSKYFEGKRVVEDIAAGNKGLELLEEGMGGFKPKWKILLRGNHEDRITRAINAEPKLDGLVGFNQFNDKALGWDVKDYLVPFELHGITYSHYFYVPNTGKPYTGSMDYRLKQVGFSFTQGHQQGFQYARRELTNGKAQVGLVAGSFYQHNEDYRGPQANSEWRGIVVCHEVKDGDYDIMQVSLDYLKRKFG